MNVSLKDFCEFNDAFKIENEMFNNFNGNYCALEIKAPKYKNWVSSSMDIDGFMELMSLYEESILYEKYNMVITGIGLLTGNNSGYLSIDFDGESTPDKLIDLFGRDMLNIINKSVSWTSGRRGRKQILFNVPNQFRYHKQKIKQVSSAVESEQIEFRYNNMQSVMPPSLTFNGIQKHYQWINSPKNSHILNLPIEICEHIFQKPEIIKPDLSKTIYRDLEKSD